MIRTTGVYSATPSMTISGGIVQDDNVDVKGIVRAAPNSSVSVNGQLATVDSAGNFFLNSVALQPGANAVVIKSISQDGASIQQTVNYNSVAVAPFKVDVSPDSGIAPPLAVTVTLTNRNLMSYGWVDINGTRFDAPATPVSQSSFTVTYPQSGTFTLTVQVRSAQGAQIWFRQHQIHVGMVSERDAKLQGVYTGMLNRLRVGNISGALTAVTDAVYDKYNTIFTTLGANLPFIVDQLGTFTDATFSDDVAEYAVVRNTANGPQRFLLYLIRGDDGIWRIEGM